MAADRARNKTSRFSIYKLKSNENLGNSSFIKRPMRRPKSAHRIISAFTKRVTPRQTPYTEHHAFPETIFGNGFNRIFRTSRAKSATRWQQRRNRIFIRTQNYDCDLLHSFLTISKPNRRTGSKPLPVPLRYLRTPPSPKPIWH